MDMIFQVKLMKWALACGWHRDTRSSTGVRFVLDKSGFYATCVISHTYLQPSRSITLLLHQLNRVDVSRRQLEFLLLLFHLPYRLPS